MSRIDYPPVYKYSCFIRPKECELIEKTDTDCRECEVYKDYYGVVDSYLEQDQVKTLSEALWLANQFLDIPSEYDCTGENWEWRKTYKPETCAEVEARQRFLLDGEVPEQETSSNTTEYQQLSLFDLV